MGEAKRRGTREQRVLEGIEKAEARRLARIEQERRTPQLLVRRRGKTRLTGLVLAGLAMAAVALSGRVEGGQHG